MMSFTAVKVQPNNNIHTHKGEVQQNWQSLFQKWKLLSRICKLTSISSVFSELLLKGFQTLFLFGSDKC